MANIAQERNASNNNTLKDLHTSFGFVIGVSLALVGIKYQGSGTTLFEQNGISMACFITAICVYAIALVMTTLRAQDLTSDRDDNDDMSFAPVFVVSGTIACELLLFVLVNGNSYLWLLVNVLAFLSIKALLRYSKIDAVWLANRAINLFRRFHQQAFNINDGLVNTSTTMNTESSINSTTDIDSGSDTRTKRGWFRQAFARVSSCGRRTLEDEGGGVTSSGNLEMTCV